MAISKNTREILTIATTDPKVADEIINAIDAAGAGGGGGGGVTVIADGASISGEYDGDVLVPDYGAAFSGDTTIRGSLLATGTLSNQALHAVTVYGDMRVAAAVWGDPGATVRAGDPVNLTVHGSLYFESISFRNSSTGQPTLSVGGNLIGAVDAASIDGSGLPLGCSGVNIVVHGSASGFNSLNLAGSPSGDGGSLTVGGALSVSEATSITLTGGTFDTGAIEDPPPGVHHGGHGGSMTVYGPATGNIDCSGGSSTNGNGGDAGSGQFSSSASPGQFLAIGGNCFSTNPTHFPGAAGVLNVLGNLSVSGTILLGGGGRFGAVVGGTNAVTCPSGGGLFVQGNTYVGSLQLNGGDSTPDSGSPAHAGDAGFMLCYGSAHIGDTFECRGGDSTCGDGGSGNGISIHGHLTTTAATVELRGGFASSGSHRGHGGSATISGGCSLATLNMVPGGGGGSSPVSTTATLFLRGHCAIDTINLLNNVTNKIRPLDATASVTLNLNVLTGITHLVGSSGTATGSISGLLPCLFVCTGGVWTYTTLTGVP